jgi:paraquat-inducible protein B
MSRKANPTMIGVFVLIAFVLGAGTILLVTSSRFFSHTKEYILYFDASLTGLDPGAPVKFRGVTVGAVKEVLVHYNQPASDSALPVIIEINADLMRKRSDATFNLLDTNQMDGYVKRGLRGKVQSQSFLTGLLFVELDFQAGTPATCHQIKREYYEIPTAPVDMQIFQVDFAEITRRLNKLLGSLDESLSQVQMRELNRGLTNLLWSLNILANSPELTNTVVSARQTLDEFRELSIALRSKIGPLATAADQTMADSRDALHEIRSGVQEVRDILAPEAILRRDLDTTLNDLSAAARSISELAEFLNRHPNALISGRKSKGEESP